MEKNRPLQIMFLGTGSDVGKSVIAAGFCRILLRHGYRVSPFKAQNMALNSFVTMDGREMGRAQVMQAYAAGILPDSDMNPILLKPSGQITAQIVVQGRVMKNESAQGYYSMKKLLLPKVLQSYERLRAQYDAIVLEGAGSTTEMNLKEKDIVNIEMAKRVRAPAVLVADIDKGGVFASIIGTMNLLTRKEKRLITGFIINKFRGDPSLFTDGIEFIQRKTRKPVFGLVPYFTDIHLPEEDSVALQLGRKGTADENAAVRIVVIHLPFISNYTDFDPFEIEESVSLLYTRNPEDIKGSSIVILPGTKNTIADLIWLRERGFDTVLKRHIIDGNTVVGICGGYQMLGNYVEDPYGVETSLKRTEGLGILDINTVLEKEKTLTRVDALSGINNINNSFSRPVPVRGYEIHMGKTECSSRLSPSFQLLNKDGGEPITQDGAVSEDGQIWGTYLHGLFENDDFRYCFLKVHGRNDAKKIHYSDHLNSQYDKLADLIEEYVDVKSVLRAASRFQ
jgi:adenosylcobyric acid synthase